MDGDALVAAGGSARLIRTRGFARSVGVELELAGASPEQREESAELLRLLARRLADGRTVPNAEGLATVPVEGADVVVRLVRVRDGDAVLRVVAPEPGAATHAPPAAALATIRLARAATLATRGELDKARLQLKRSIELFPGDPARCSGDHRAPRNYNWENHLSYLALSRHTRGAESHVLYREALRRSQRFTTEESGGLPAALRAMSVGEARALANQILRHNLSHNATDDPITSSIAVFRSPLWSLGPSGRTVRRRVVMPASFARLYYTGAGRAALGSSSAADIAADALLRHDPIDLLVLTLETRTEWSEPDAPVLRTSEVYHPAQGLLSALLAEIARRAAAGCSAREVRAALCLVDDPVAARSAQCKTDGLPRAADWEAHTLATRARGHERVLLLNEDDAFAEDALTPLSPVDPAMGSRLSA